MGITPVSFIELKHHMKGDLSMDYFKLILDAIVNILYMVIDYKQGKFSFFDYVPETEE